MDVVPALNEAITHSFETNMIADRRLNRITKRIRDGTATLTDAHRYSQYTGENLSKALVKNLTAETLPDSTLYYNIANRTVTPALKNCHGIVSNVAKQCQALVDEGTQLGIESIAADFPEERIHGLIDKMCSYGDDIEKSLVWLKEPIVNNVEAFYDDFIRSNADFRDRIGLEEKIVRVAEANACEWCSSLEGEYDYGSEPPEVYQRHEFCRCDVKHISKKGTKTDVWSKKSWQSSKEEIDQRKKTQFVQMSPEERKKLIESVR